MEFLKKSFFVYLNQRTIKAHGGQFVAPYNLLHPESLDYIVEAVEGEIFGQQMYPRVSDKAALYMHSVIANHIFQDGNKRTGLEAALLFLELNGHKIDPNLTKKQLEDFTISVADGSLDLDAVKDWFEEWVVEK